MTPDKEPVVVLAFLTDLIFQTKIVSTGSTLGVDVKTVRDPGELKQSIARHAPALVLVDLNASNGLEAVASAMQQDDRHYRVIAYVSHVDRALAEAATEAGVDDVLPRSRFTVELPALIRSCLENESV
ncbi:MAG: hypothetical protein ACPGXK_12040 [Phycisphaerae bacterium]